MFVYVIISFVADQLIVAFRPHRYPLLGFTIYSVFTFAEFVAFSCFIFLVYRNKYFKYILVSTSFLFIAFTLFHYFSNIGKETFDSLPASIESILIITFCIFFFFDQVNTPEISLIYESYKFWVIIGFLLYLAPVLFLFVFESYVSKEERAFYWNINYTFNILKNIFFSIAFVMKKDIKSDNASAIVQYNNTR